MLRAFQIQHLLQVRAHLLALALALLATAISSPLWAQDRQQASLAIEHTRPRNTPLFDDRVRPHGPVADPGRGALLKRAMERHGRGDAAGALAAYDEAIRAEPGNAVALLNRGILLSTHRAEPARALADFDRALALAAGNVDALVFRGDAHMRLASYRQALADFDRAAALAPANAQTHVLRAVAKAMLGDHAEARAGYTKALSLDTRNVDALVNRAAMAAASGDNAAALRDLDAAIAIEPRNARAHYNRGYVRFARQEHDRAIGDYTAAIDLDPRLGWAWLNRCLSRAVAGRDVGRALADCDEAQRLFPASPQVRALTAQIERLISASATN